MCQDNLYLKATAAVKRLKALIGAHHLEPAAVCDDGEECHGV